MRMSPLRPAIALLCCSSVFTLPALGQSAEYELTEDGEWRTISEPEPGSDAAFMSRMRRLLIDDDPGEARKRLDVWLEDNRTSRAPERPQALLLRADSLVLLDREFSALYDYEDIIRNHPQSAEFHSAIGRELAIADTYVKGLKLRSFGFRYGDPEPIIREIYIRTGERIPGSDLAERALISLADYYYSKREMSLARDSYEVYLLNFPEGPHAEHAEARRVFTDIARFKGPRYDAASLYDAQIRVRNFIRRHPETSKDVGIDGAMLTRIDESIAAQLLDSAEWYVTREDWPSALHTLRRLVLAHPDSLSAARAREMLEERNEDAQLPDVPGFRTAPADADSQIVPTADDLPGDTK